MGSLGVGESPPPTSQSLDEFSQQSCPSEVFTASIFPQVLSVDAGSPPPSATARTPPPSALSPPVSAAAAACGDEGDEGEDRTDGTEALLTFEHHAQYNPRVTNPMNCVRDAIERGCGGVSATLHKVPTDRCSSNTKDFYNSQNEAIDSFAEMDELRMRISRGDAEEEEGDDSTAIKIGVRGSLMINVAILAAKVFLVITTGSVAFVASLLDSVLDILSGLALVIANMFVNTSNRAKYPLGKQTFEPLGTLVFSACMFTASFQLIQYSTQVLISGSHDVTVDVTSMALIGGIIVTKTLMFIYCRRYRDVSTAMDALATDHRNDTFSNLIGVAAAVVAYKYSDMWFIDPATAVLITLYIMYTWATTGCEQIMSLSGKAAPSDVIRQLTYTAQHHHPSILFVDTVRAVAMGGTGYQVEVDIVLPPTMKLREAHDIGESLQLVLERASCVSRAYVHLDYEFNHSPWDHR